MRKKLNDAAGFGATLGVYLWVFVSFIFSEVMPIFYLLLFLPFSVTFMARLTISSEYIPRRIQTLPETKVKELKAFRKMWTFYLVTSLVLLFVPVGLFEVFYYID